jgi:hypothetical protein
VVERASKRALACLLIALVAVTAAAPAEAATPSRKKSIWGPVQMNGVSQFALYRELGVGILQMSIAWSTTAPTRPQNPSDPADPAYRWPPEIDVAIAEGARRGIAVSILLNGAPSWANGGRDPTHAPRRPKDFADFAAAAARRYPAVRHWMIWGEPSKLSRFQPLVPAMGRRLSAAQRRGPRRYARILDVSYVALKRVNRRNLVVGGNTWTGGEVVPLNFIKAMRLPSGRRPRMDLYGHNPFTLRTPRLSRTPSAYGHADFSDLDTLAHWLDRHGYRDRRGRRLRLFLSELSIPTDHANFEFNFWVPRATQARWLRAALKITRRWSRIYTLGYLGLYDDPPRPDGREVNRGLITFDGRRKPAFRAFREG